MEEGDHQLYVYVDSLQPNGTVAVEYFEYVVHVLQFATIIVFLQRLPL
jgi:hypothetical protein